MCRRVRTNQPWRTASSRHAFLNRCAWRAALTLLRRPCATVVCCYGITHKFVPPSPTLPLLGSPPSCLHCRFIFDGVASSVSLNCCQHLSLTHTVCAECGRAGCHGRAADGKERGSARQLHERAVRGVPRRCAHRQVCRGARRQAGDAAFVPQAEMPCLSEAIDCHVWPVATAALVCLLRVSPFATCTESHCRRSFSRFRRKMWPRLIALLSWARLWRSSRSVRS